jgi:hypothetical protein
MPPAVTPGFFKKAFLSVFEEEKERVSLEEEEEEEEKIEKKKSFHLVLLLLLTPHVGRRREPNRRHLGPVSPFRQESQSKSLEDNCRDNGGGRRCQGVFRRGERRRRLGGSAGASRRRRLPRRGEPVPLGELALDLLELLLAFLEW